MKLKHFGFPLFAASMVAAFTLAGEKNSAGALATCTPIETDEGAWHVADFNDIGSCRFVLPDDANTVNVFVLGGGGAGGWSDADAASGGGSGGLVTGLLGISSRELTIIVGSGGVGHQDALAPTSANGQDSSIITDEGMIIAYGGARGTGFGDSVGVSGGSGSGAHGTWAQAGTATKGTATAPGSFSYWGNDGGTSDSNASGGGGGGVATPEYGGVGGSGASGNGGAGGVGMMDSFWHAARGYGGGGCGEVSNGGGSGAHCLDNAPGESAPANSGSGGGASFNGPSGSGGSGFIQLSWMTTAATTTTAVTTTTSDTTTPDTTAPDPNERTLANTGNSGSRNVWAGVMLIFSGVALLSTVRRRRYS